VFSALLDTCVLWSPRQRDFLLSLAAEGLYRPLWSEAILDELHYCEIDRLTSRGEAPDDALAKSDRLIAAMRQPVFSDALVHGWEPLEGRFGLPDPDDEHLVAAAVIGRADVIVSDNLKDLTGPGFPADLGILLPADFILATVELDPTRALAALTNMSNRRQRPPETVEELLDSFSTRYGLAEAMNVIRAAQR
jgi:hypothetical protein